MVYRPRSLLERLELLRQYGKMNRVFSALMRELELLVESGDVP